MTLSNISVSLPNSGSTIVVNNPIVEEIESQFDVHYTSPVLKNGIKSIDSIDGLEIVVFGERHTDIDLRRKYSAFIDKYGADNPILVECVMALKEVSDLFQHNQTCFLNRDVERRDIRGWDAQDLQERYKDFATALACHDKFLQLQQQIVSGAIADEEAQLRTKVIERETLACMDGKFRITQAQLIRARNQKLADTLEAVLCKSGQRRPIFIVGGFGHFNKELQKENSSYDNSAIFAVLRKYKSVVLFQKGQSVCTIL